MTFKKGDRVKFLNDVGGGIITRIDNKTVYVETEDGFEVPSTIQQLLKVNVSQAESSPFTRTVSDASIPTTEAQTQTTETPSEYVDLTDDSDDSNIDTSVNILLAWIAQRKNDGKTAYDLYLINDCGYNIMYVTAMIKDAAYRGIQAGMLESDTTIHLTQIPTEDLKLISSIRFDILFFKKGKYLPQEPMRYELKTDEFFLCDPVNYVSTAYFEEKALIYNISEEYLMSEIENVAVDVQKQFEKQKKQIDATPPTPELPKKNTDPETEEVDLHIEQLVDNPKAFTPAELLEIQMGHFKGTLEEAIRTRKKRIIFIHGVGNGRLRLEINRALDKKYPKLRYQDASFKEYGYGATMVMLKG